MFLYDVGNGMNERKKDSTMDGCMLYDKRPTYVVLAWQAGGGKKEKKKKKKKSARLACCSDRLGTSKIIC